MTLYAPRSWRLGGELDACDGASAPYQRLAGGVPVDERRAASLRAGGDDLWRVAVGAGLLSHRVPAHAALRAPPAPLAPVSEPCAAGLPDDAVAIGVVDGPVAFAHRRFRTASGGTRLDWLWLLDPHCVGGSGDAPFGCELTRADLDALIARHATPRGVDEEAVYRAVRHLDMARPYARDVARRATHGSAVLGLAASGSPAVGEGAAGCAVDARPEAFPLMVAALPAQLLGDTSGAFNALHVVLALDRMLRRAASVGLARGRPLPIVVSISLGLSGGPKDGSGLLERYIDAVSAADIPGLGPRRFVLPVGNERQSRLCARVEAPLGPDASPLWWRLPPDDGTSSFLEIWSRPLTARPESCGLNLGVQPPGVDDIAFMVPLPGERRELLSVSATKGRPSPARPPESPAPSFGRVYGYHPLGGCQACAYVQWQPDDPGQPDGPGRARITLAVPPTRPDPRPRKRSGAMEFDGGCASPGDWRIFLLDSGAGPSCFPCDLYIQRDDSLDVDRPRGRQSRLIDPAYRPFDETGRRPMRDDPEARVRRSGAINAYATAREAVLAGGRWGHSGAEVPYSGAGDGRPVLFAVTDDSPARPGVRVIGTRSGGVARYRGTSMAAPVVARDLAARISAELRAASA